MTDSKKISYIINTILGILILIWILYFTIDMKKSLLGIAWIVGSIGISVVFAIAEIKNKKKSE